MRLDLERAGPAIANVDDAGVLSRSCTTSLLRVGSRFRCTRDDLYEQCSLHITLKIPSSVSDGSRPSEALIRSIFVRRNAVVFDHFRCNSGSMSRGHGVLLFSHARHSATRLIEGRLTWRDGTAPSHALCRPGLPAGACLRLGQRHANNYGVKRFIISGIICREELHAKASARQGEAYGRALRDAERGNRSLSVEAIPNALYAEPPWSVAVIVT